MKHLLLFLILVILEACTSTPDIPPPTEAVASPTAVPADEVFIAAFYERIDRDDTIPECGKLAVAALYTRRPTHMFQQNDGIVLQFNILDKPGLAEAKRAAVLLAGTGVIVAGERSVPLSGIEVVFYKDETAPWLAMAVVQPWWAEQIIFTSPDENLLEDLMPTATPLPTS